MSNYYLANPKFALYKVAADYSLATNLSLTANTAMTPEKVTEIVGILEGETANKAIQKYTYEEDETPADQVAFGFKGIDDGRYVLVETETPAGYNTMLPLIFDVSATHTDGDTPALTALNGDKITGELNTADLTTKVADGTLEKDIANYSGAVLPSTGGVGTTIFYVAGSLMVLAAAILLITKRRMGAND